MKKPNWRELTEPQRTLFRLQCKAVGVPVGKVDFTEEGFYLKIKSTRKQEGWWFRAAKKALRKMYPLYPDRYIDRIIRARYLHCYWVSAETLSFKKKSHKNRARSEKQGGQII